MNLYRPNRRFDRAFAHSDEARDFVLRKAEEGVEHARANAPVRTGTYRASIGASVVEESDGWKGHLTAGAAHAIYVEYGTEDTPIFATLRRAGEVIERT